MDKKIFKIIKTTIYILLAFILLLITSTIIISKLNTGINIDIYSVQSGSMQPAIKAGSIVITQEQEKYSKGDIVTFITDTETTVTHRIVRIEGTSFYTQGDANNIEDGKPINQEQIVGKVILTIPLLGYPFAFAKTPTGFILLIIIPAILIIAGEIANISKELTNIRNKKVEENTN